MTSSTDRIEKKVVLRAPLARVWRAVGNAEEFGDWFGMKLEGDFVPGTRLLGRIVPTKADPEVAKGQEPYTNMKLEIFVERVEPEQLLSFRWHPFAIEPGVDDSGEPTTLVVLRLESVPEGTQLTITESGFDQLPLERRAKAFEMNDGGWAAQTRLIEKHLAHAA